MDLIERTTGDGSPVRSSEDETGAEIASGVAVRQDTGIETQESLGPPAAYDYPTGEAQGAGPTSADLIYPAYHDLGSRELGRAVTLLGQSEALLAEALKYLSDSAPIRSDYEVSRFRALLPELFCCRSLGDGFGAIIVAIGATLENQPGPMDVGGLRALKKTVSRLRSRPFLTVEDADDLVESLEESGLNTLPAAVSILLEPLDDPSIR